MHLHAEKFIVGDGFRVFGVPLVKIGKKPRRIMNDASPRTLKMEICAFLTHTEDYAISVPFLSPRRDFRPFRIPPPIPGNGAARFRVPARDRGAAGADKVEAGPPAMSPFGTAQRGKISFAIPSSCAGKANENRLSGPFASENPVRACRRFERPGRDEIGRPSVRRRSFCSSSIHHPVSVHTPMFQGSNQAKRSPCVRWVPFDDANAGSVQQE